MKIIKALLFLVISLCLITCRDDENAPADPYPDLKIYLDRFQAESKKRGLELDLSAVRVVYVENIVRQGKSYCGWGYDNTNNSTRRIEISKATDCGWSNRSDTERENLIFHEIGHAFLNRGHDETLLCDGTPLTLMNSTPQYAWHIYREQESAKRDYYISELTDRLVAVDKCIAYDHDWDVDPWFYTNSAKDNEWIFYSANSKYTGQNNGVLSIASADVSPTESGYFFKQFINPNIPECAEVKLRVRMQSSGITGQGVAIALRLYESALSTTGAELSEYLVLTTETNPASGLLTDHIEELTIPCYSRNTSIFIPFVVMLPGTKGEVSFDEIELIVKEN